MIIYLNRRTYTIKNFWNSYIITISFLLVHGHSSVILICNRKSISSSLSPSIVRHFFICFGNFSSSPAAVKWINPAFDLLFLSQLLIESFQYWFVIKNTWSDSFEVVVSKYMMTNLWTSLNIKVVDAWSTSHHRISRVFGWYFIDSFNFLFYCIQQL